MKTVKKEILINADIYLTFSSKLMELKEIVTGETQTLLLELTEILQKEMTDIETFFEKFRKLEQKKLLDALTCGVIYFFVARIYSKRKEFALSLSLLEKSETCLAQENSDLCVLIAKEAYVLKMAYRYNEN